MTKIEGFDEKFEAFFASAQALVNEYYALHYPSLTPNTLTCEPGSRYVKIVANVSDGQRYVWGFVDKTNGNILKAAGWKAPAKHARGNIFDSNPVECCTSHGPKYLK